MLFFKSFLVNTFYSHPAALSPYVISPHAFPYCNYLRAHVPIKRKCEKNEKTNGKIYVFLIHIVTSGCDVNNEVDSLQHNWDHPDRFGDHIICVEFLLMAPEQERSSFDLPAKWFRYV